MNHTKQTNQIKIPLLGERPLKTRLRYVRSFLAHALATDTLFLLVGGFFFNPSKAKLQKSALNWAGGAMSFIERLSILIGFRRTRIKTVMQPTQMMRAARPIPYFQKGR